MATWLEITVVNVPELVQLFIIAYKSEMQLHQGPQGPTLKNQGVWVGAWSVHPL